MKRSLCLSTSLLLNLLLTVNCSKLIAFSFGNIYGDSVRNQIDSAESNGIHLEVIETSGHGEPINKLRLFKDRVASMKEENETIVLLVNSGSLFINSSSELKLRFKTMKSRLVLSSDNNCRPDPHLKESYPKVSEKEKRFVNAHGIIGYADTLALALKEESLRAVLDLQHYFTKLFINPDLRTKYQMKLDSKSSIFQNMDGSFDDKAIQYSATGNGFIYDAETGEIPLILQTADNRKTLLGLSNYIGHAWDPINGCKHCSQNRISLTNKDANEFPYITVALFIDQPTPFLSEFFTRISSLSYPKSKIKMRLSNSIPVYEKVIKTFTDESQDLYNTLVYIDSSDERSLADRRTEAIKSCQKSSCDYLFFVDSVVQITKKDTIESLISYNKSIVAPMVSRRGKLWSNFWGAISYDGYYSRSFDYLEIIEGEKTGLWNVPLINNIYLMKREFLHNLDDIYTPLEEYKKSELDLVFSGNLRNKDRFMFVTNEEDYGYMVDAESTKTEHLHNDLWEIFANPLDWEEKYIHENYSSVADESIPLKDIAQPCPDVFWWPFLSNTFTTHMIEEMEFFGEWSEGKNSDSRLEGGYENVPTRDIHMRQVDWEEHWMQVLDKYVHPMQLKLFKGYYDKPRARMNFVVRYKPTEQDRLRPHHDSASYTLNIALNSPGLDYEGGGANFLRYKCAIIKSRVGWVLMHPGRVTHLHEGLPTTKGTRYIFVTFVNP